MVRLDVIFGLIFLFVVVGVSISVAINNKYQPEKGWVGKDRSPEYYKYIVATDRMRLYWFIGIPLLIALEVGFILLSPVFGW